MKTLISVVVFAGSLLLCSCNEVKEGGGCTYKTTIIPATLIELVDYNDESYDAVFAVEIEKINDTVYYSRVNNGGYLFKSKSPKGSLIVGKQYQYIIQKILTGSCTPEVRFIDLKPYAAQ